jgi:hypothetical protein
MHDSVTISKGIHKLQTKPNQEKRPDLKARPSDLQAGTATARVPVNRLVPENASKLIKSLVSLWEI